MTLPYWLGHRFFDLAARSLFDYRVVNPERLQVPGGALIVCNHTSFLDPPFVGIAFDSPIHYFARKTLFAHPIANRILRSWNAIPVDQDKPDASSVKTVIRLLREQEKVLIFPEGTRSEDGIVKEAEPGTGLIIAKAQAPVIPVRIFGTHEALPKNAHFIRPAKISVVVGETWRYDPTKFHVEGKKLYQQISDEIIGLIGDLSL